MWEEVSARNVNQGGGRQVGGVGDTDCGVMGEYREVKYIPKPQDEESPGSGMIYRRVLGVVYIRWVRPVERGEGRIVATVSSIPPPTHGESG